MTEGSVTIVQGDARNLTMLADESVDLIVTSPPYFALRSYTDGGQHYAGQVGSEATPAEFIAALIECTREWMRVLKPSGSIWVNLGDKYANDAKWGGATSGKHVAGLHGATGIGRAKQRTGMPAKSLMLLPERYRIAAVDELGLIARAVVIWSKPNGLPESVTDRVRRSHEDWVHLTKQPRYFSAVDEIREPHTTGKRGQTRSERTDRRAATEARWGHRDEKNTQLPPQPGDPSAFHALGKLPGSVWEIASQPLTVPKELGVDHFAAFPMEWPRRIILGWSPSGICVECGEGRRPVTVSQRTSNDALRPEYGAGNHDKGGSTLGPRGVVATIISYACACPDSSAPTRPAIVLDPFGGTGTTALVASVLGRHGISVDLSADYCRLAQWRTTDPKQIERAARPAKPRPTPPPPAQPEPFTATDWLAHFGLESS